MDRCCLREPRHDGPVCSQFTDDTEMGMIEGGQTSKGRFIVLLGIDGSGKTSLLRALAARGLRTAQWQQLRDHDVPAALAPTAPTAVKNGLTPLARAMFIGGHLVAQYEYLVRPQIETGRTVVLDSYYFKVLAKERILGVAHPALVDLCAELPQPDLLLHLDVTPQESRRRKQGRISSYEHFEPDETTYLTFQTRLAAHLRAAARESGCFLTLNGNQCHEAVVQDALDAMAGLRNHGAAS